MEFDATLTAKHQLDILAALQPHPAQIALVGSMAIDHEGNDYDYVVLVAGDTMGESIKSLKAHGFRLSSFEEGGSGSDDGWLAFRKEKANVMLTDDEQFYQDFIVSTRVCQHVSRLLADSSTSRLDRDERIKLHRIIMNGEEP